MNTVHRQFGKLKRRGGDQANVAMLLNEYEDADKMLTKVRAYTFLTQCAFGASLTKFAVDRGIERLERRLGFYPQHPSDSDHNFRRTLPTDCWLKRWIRTTASHEHPGAARADVQIEISIRGPQD